MNDATQVEVTFHSPSLADMVPPLGLFGPGKIEFGAEGVTLRGQRASKWGTWLFGCLGVFVFMILGIGAAATLGTDTSVATTILLPLLCAGGGLGVLAARKLTPAKAMTVVVPWSHVQSLELDGKWITFISTGTPKGQAWFAALGGVEATEQLHQQIAAAGKWRVMKTG